jgi:ankyrin repeat protein
MSLLDLENTPLMKACVEKNTKLALELLEMGPEACQLDAKSFPHFRLTALQVAISHRLEEVALKMLEYGPEANCLEHIDSTESTALVYSLDFGLTKVANRILDFPDECDLYEVDNEMKTALTHCCINGYVKLALRILGFGAHKHNLEVRDIYNCSALDYAKEKGLTKVIAKITEMYLDLEGQKENLDDSYEYTDNGIMI